MKDILNKPISELFKKNSTADSETQTDENENLNLSRQTHFLNRPISSLFKKTSHQAIHYAQDTTPQNPPTTSFLNTPISGLFKKNNISPEQTAQQVQPVNILRRPISELFKRDPAISRTEDTQQTDPSMMDQFKRIIDRLDAEYEAILIAFTDIQHFIAKQNMPAITQHLEQFRHQFKTYLVLESGLLHHHLKNAQMNSDEEAHILSLYRMENHRFTNTILRFLRKWTEQKQVSSQNLCMFEEDYVETYDVLADRMHHEYSIFNLLNRDLQN